MSSSFRVPEGTLHIFEPSVLIVTLPTQSGEAKHIGAMIASCATPLLPVGLYPTKSILFALQIRGEDF